MSCDDQIIEQAPFCQFKPTGHDDVDRILAAISKADASCLNTEQWATEYAEWKNERELKTRLTYLEVIQREANFLAMSLHGPQGQQEAETPALDRDELALRVLAGLNRTDFSEDASEGRSLEDQMAEHSYALADAIIRARGQKDTTPPAVRTPPKE